MKITAPGLRTDLALLELQGSEVVDAGDHVVVRTPANPAFYWGNFILLPTAVPEDAIDHWIERFEAEFPQARHRAIGFADAEGEHAGWRSRGFDVEVDVDLALGDAVPAASDLPGGIDVRPLASDDDWEQSAALGASDVPDDGRDDHLLFELRRAVAQRGMVDSGRGRWLGAFDGDRLVASLGIVRLGRLARYQNVMTRADYRKRGIAGALVRAAGEWARSDPEVEQLVIVAEEGGPAIGLYQRAGFTEVARHVEACRRPQ
jgi:ribosomal protein S18 acetylase RimI-like enzyme